MGAPAPAIPGPSGPRGGGPAGCGDLDPVATGETPKTTRPRRAAVAGNAARPARRSPTPRFSARPASRAAGAGTATASRRRGALDPSELDALLGRFDGIPIALLGDLVLDEFAYGEIARVSREAPVLILEYKESRFAPGGGANAAANLAALGAAVRPVGRVGRDEAGARLLELLEERWIARTGIVLDSSYRTPVKTRILAGSAHTSKQQVVRLDKGPAGQPLGRAGAAAIVSRLGRATRGAQALLVADYGFGAASPAIFAAARHRPRIVTLDSRFRVLEFHGVTAATPNVAEVEQALDVRIPDDEVRPLKRAGARLRRLLGAEALVATQGSRGMTLFEAGQDPVHFPPFGSDEIADVTGAGDTVISAFTLTLAAGGSFTEATAIANIAGGLVVMKRGTATVTAEEIARALDSEATPLLPPERL
jgi:rfaE bifunctional protein kinase chain/domain